PNPTAPAIATPATAPGPNIDIDPNNPTPFDNPMAFVNPPTPCIKAPTPNVNLPVTLNTGPAAAANNPNWTMFFCVSGLKFANHCVKSFALSTTDSIDGFKFLYIVINKSSAID